MRRDTDVEEVSKEMTLVIDLSPAEESWLTDAAQQTGLTPAILAKNLLTQQLPRRAAPQADFEEARIAAIWAACGSMAQFTDTGVEDLHRQRQADKHKEEAQ
jgi:hypothetical protein